MPPKDVFLDRRNRTRLAGLTVDETIEYQVLFALALLGKDEELRLLELYFKHRHAVVYDPLDRKQTVEKRAPNLSDDRKSSISLWKLAVCVTTFAILATSVLIALFSF
jgi:hypothetical protein